MKSTAVPLTALIDALEQMKFLLVKVEPSLTNDEYLKGLGAYSALHSEVAHLVKEIKVEVAA